MCTKAREWVQEGLLRLRGGAIKRPLWRVLRLGVRQIVSRRLYQPWRQRLLPFPFIQLHLHLIIELLALISPV